MDSLNNLYLRKEFTNENEFNTLNLLIMKKNMGSADRMIRIIIAVVIGALYYMDIISGTLGIVLMILAIVFLLTSFVSFCPLYSPFGLNTKAKKE